ncbi:hypothetical protein WNY78_08665 [Psychroserpens sp. AS72]|uniref:hypothetical protein n=1 Tax=Psychroserpens sp. AS72 TaxID=3135775 RepID=UPI00317BE9A4
MTSKRKKIGLIFIGVFILALAGLFYAKHLVTTKFEEMVENLPNHIDLQYDTKDFDIVSGNFKLEKLLLTIKGKVTNDINAQIALESFSIKDLSYWELYSNDAINIESIRVVDPKITYYHNKNVEGQSYNDVLKENFNKSFSFKKINIDNARVEVFDMENDSILFSSENLNFESSSIVSNSIENSNLPFTFDGFLLTSENTKYKLNDFDNLFVKSIAINSKNSKLSEVKLQTKYAKQELSKHLKTERDHFDLNVASVEIKNQKLITKKDSTMSFVASNLIFNNLNFDIYRDKLVNDDLEHKLLYSKMLRQLTFGLDLKEITIHNGLITYEEKVKSDKKAGKLDFTNLEAKISNVSNMNEEGEQTTIDITSNFMGNTPLKVNWNFDVKDVNDAFVFKADLGMLKAESLNQFMQPNLNIKLEGELAKTYFTIDGTANTSIVNLKTNYDQFDVIILREDGKEKNKFLSGLVNLFISKNSNDESNDFRASDTVTLERDKTKSIFNFVWKNAQSGLLSAMAGDGKKEK